MSDKNFVREERIIMDIVVDAYDSEERSLGWYYYLADKISFPFAAECIAIDKRTPLKLKERITVQKMSGEDYCVHDMLVDISWKSQVLAIPLAQIQPMDADEDTAEAIGDWHYWKKQGYVF
jgi:hypothetical protein